MAQPNWYRICVGCGKARPKKELLRIVKCHNNHLEIDPDQTKPGRGAYICPEAECAILAKKNRGFNRSFHLAADQKFYDYLIQQVEQIDHGRK